MFFYLETDNVHLWNRHGAMIDIHCQLKILPTRTDGIDSYLGFSFLLLL